jgi:heptosyltransferase I
MRFDRPPERVCIIRLSAIGDTCHTLPVVRAMQDAWPETKITWIIGRLEHQLMRGLEGVEFIVVDKSLGWRGYLGVRPQLAERRFAVLLHMHPSLGANIVSLFVKAPIRLGYDRESAKDFQYLFCNRHIAARPRRHVMDLLFDFATELGIEHGPPRWQIPLEPGDTELAARALRGERPSLLISPCAVARFRNYRNWRPERYAAVARYASDTYGAQIVLTGGPSETERLVGAQIEEAARCDVTNLIGKTSLKQLLALIARASVVLCGDSGPAHMATAVGTPVVGLYATTNRHRAGPYFSQHLVVDKYPEAVRAEFGVPVEEIPWGRRVRDPAAMDLIEVVDVTEKLDLAFANLTVERVADPSS